MRTRVCSCGWELFLIPLTAFVLVLGVFLFNVAHVLIDSVHISVELLNFCSLSFLVEDQTEPVVF